MVVKAAMEMAVATKSEAERKRRPIIRIRRVIPVRISVSAVIAVVGIGLRIGNDVKRGRRGRGFTHRRRLVNGRRLAIGGRSGYYTGIGNGRCRGDCGCGRLCGGS